MSDSEDSNSEINPSETNINHSEVTWKKIAPTELNCVLKNTEGKEIVFYEKYIGNKRTGYGKCGELCRVKEIKIRRKRNPTNRNPDPFSPLILQNLKRHALRHHSDKKKKTKKDIKFDKKHEVAIKKKLTQFMVENGLSLDVFKKDCWSELLVSIFDGELEKEELKKLCPSARTISRAMVDNRQTIVNALSLRGTQLVREGKLYLALDHKKFEMANEVYSDCLGLLIIYECHGKKLSYLLNFKPVKSKTDAETTEIVSEMLEEIGLEDEFQSRNIPFVGDAALRSFMDQNSDLSVICWNHNHSNLVKRVFRKRV